MLLCNSTYKFNFNRGDYDIKMNRDWNKEFVVGDNVKDTWNYFKILNWNVTCNCIRVLKLETVVLRWFGFY